MNLKEQIHTALKEAMKSKDQVRINAIRLLFSEILNEDKIVENDKVKKRETQQIVLSWKKKLCSSIEFFTDPLVRKVLENEIGIIDEFCPKMINKDEIHKTISGMLENKDIEIVNMKSMKTIMTKLKGLANGKDVMEVVKTWNG